MSETKSSPLSKVRAELAGLTPKGKTLLVAVDGGGASGKTTFAEELAGELGGNTALIHFDDFYKPTSEQNGGEWGENFDWQRLKDQVLIPLSEGRAAKYQRYDWPTDKLAEWHEVPAGGTVIVDGVYSCRSELRDFYDFAVWIETPEEVRLKRGLQRDGKGAEKQWREWLAQEADYVKAQNPANGAELVLAGH